MKQFFLMTATSLMMLASCGNASENASNENDSADTTVTDVTPTVAEATDTANGTQVAQANLMYTADSTKAMGSAKFYALSDGKIRLDVEINMPERADSNVAVHFHEHGDCGNKGDNTHGHWNPTNEKHGKWASSSFHSGDIGNILLDKAGHGTISITSDRWSVENGNVKDIIGKGIIVHGGTDDYTTQPTGNSGPRVGCGVITKL